MKNKIILITGGAGFIGSHVIRLFVDKYPNYQIINLDKLTYAGNLENLNDLKNKSNYHFEKGCITDSDFIKSLFDKYHFDAVIHLAAESHVDRSITNPMEFVETNVLGTVNLLNIARKHWGDDLDNKLFYQVSTDEVYGSLGEDGMFDEEYAYDPRSPYSASKSSADHFVRAYFHTYKLPIVISNCSNNYGPNQFPEKLIPLLINNILLNKPIPVYGDGSNVRDWLYVVDHARAIDKVFHNGIHGETYCVGGNNEWTNLNIVKKVCDLLDQKLDRTESSQSLITFVTDRKGHDQRYAINNSKILEKLNWSPEETFETGMVKTINWYLDNPKWLEHVTSGAYQNYYEKMYCE